MHRKQIFWYMFAIALIIMLVPVNAYAEEATVTFGSESYSVSRGNEFNIGVYINSDSSIGYYRIELEYDNTRLKYISGGEAESEGVIVLEGTGFGNHIKYWLTLQAISSGEAGIIVKDTYVNQSISEGNEILDVKEHILATITVSGNSEQELTFPEMLNERERQEKEAEATLIENRYPVLGTVEANGSRYYIIDHSEYVPEDVAWNYNLSSGNFSDIDVTFLADKENRVGIIYLMDEAEAFHPYAVNSENEAIYQVYVGNGFIYVTGLACNSYPDGITRDIVETNNLALVIYKNGESELAQMSVEGEVIRWNGTEDESEPETTDSSTDVAATTEQTNKNFGINIAAVIILISAITVAVAIYIYIKSSRTSSKKKKTAKSDSNKAIDMVALEDDDSYVFLVDDDQPTEEDYEESEKEKPVISIQNVTMKFRVSTSDASGLKEFLIQKIKKKVTYRELLALNDVSFDIYKGEVVGIIGTNGSGKSTLLRIVSGALRPTSGQVIVDRSKVQLLTLGTGFDMELTARENVYLNGAIIGYTKKFLDDHFDEIIEFAELQDFVDEKVKNFSSGMVSRLGFAIATVGDAAEILILDEVLSVGDEFFRKKSLARIKEMIHGGSTVLMVSHGMGTITENCTKAVWIEKGVLQMVGDTKTVCKKYQEMGGT